jgi:predicted nucleic acid-binding protein
VTLVIDAGPLVAAADQDDPIKPRIEALLRSEPGDLIIAAPVTAEIDYLLGQRLGRVARLAFLEDLAAGRFTVACLEPADQAMVVELEKQYADQDVGLADLSTVVVAGRYATSRILTFDERHFRSLRPIDGGHFTLLPIDSATE